MSAQLTVEQAIGDIDRAIFTTREVAAVRSASVSGTSQALSRMERQGLIIRVSRGLWCIPDDSRFTRFALVPFLARDSRAYVSLLSALSLHGVIDQVPQVVYAVTTGVTRLVDTSLGRFSYHRMQSTLFGGFDWNGNSHAFLLASPEKALVDALYLSSRKGRRFRYLPELDVSAEFDVNRLRAWIDRIEDPVIKTSVARRATALNLGWS